jgi:hypothetical protein
MKTRMLVLPAAAAASAVAIVLEYGNADLVKGICLLSSAICGAEYARIKYGARALRVILSAAASAAVVWACVGFVVVLKQPWEGTWGGKLSFAVYIGTAAFVFCGVVGAFIGFIYYAFARSTSER